MVPRCRLSVTYSGLVGGDTPATFSTTPNQAPVLSTAPATSDVGTYGITAANAIDPNYTIIYKSGSLTITPFAFSYTIASDSQTYGTAANLAHDLGTTINTGINNQTLDIAYASTGDTTTAHVGSYGITGIVSSGTGKSSDFTVTLQNGSLAVNAYAFTYTIANDTQTYGTAVNLATALGTTINTGVNNQTLDIAYASTGDTTAAHVGSYGITGTVSTSTGQSSDYAVTFMNGSLTVSPYAFTYTIGTAAQTYGTPANLATALGTTISTGVNNQNLDITYASTGDTTTAHVGSYGITGTVSTGSGQSSDYAVTFINGSLTVSPYAFTYTIGTAAQTYGTPANLAIALGTTISTGVNNQTLDIAYASTGDTTTAHVGSYGITGTVSTGSGQSSDYAVTFMNGSLTVSPYAFTYTIGTAAQTYGTAANLATALGTTINTGVNNQNLDITYASTGDTTAAHVGSYGITGTVSTGSGQSSDYAVTLKNGSLTVSPYAFTYTIGTAAQTYGAPANLATALGTTINTGVNNQTLDIAYASTGDTATAQVGSYSITGNVSTGTGQSTDYAVTLKNGSLSVSPYAFTYTIGTDTQTYGTPVNLATVLGTTINTGVNNQTLDIAYASTGDTITAQVGSYGITGTVSTGTGQSTDYAVTLKNGSLTVSPASLTITANNQTKVFGQTVTLAGTAFTEHGLINTDAITSVTLTSTGAAATATVSGSPYAIVPSASPWQRIDQLRDRLRQRLADRQSRRRPRRRLRFQPPAARLARQSQSPQWSPPTPRLRHTHRHGRFR